MLFQFNLRTCNESGPPPLGYALRHSRGTMLMRGIGAVTLTVSLSSEALAERQPGVMHRISCTMVRVYVARYSASTAEMWARSHGATEAQLRENA